MICVYCKHSIDSKTSGWGFTKLLGAYIEFHTECFEQSEGVLVAT